MQCYHVTPQANLASIREVGLRSCPSRYNGRLRSRAGYVYLNTALHYAARWYREIYESQMEPVVLAVDCNGPFVADEDHFEREGSNNFVDQHGLPSRYVGEGTHAASFFGLRTPGQREKLAVWAEEHQEKLVSELVINYSKAEGSVAYYGQISWDKMRMLTEEEALAMEHINNGWYGFPKGHIPRYQAMEVAA